MASTLGAREWLPGAISGVHVLLLGHLLRRRILRGSIVHGPHRLTPLHDRPSEREPRHPHRQRQSPFAPFLDGGRRGVAVQVLELLVGRELAAVRPLLNCAHQRVSVYGVQLALELVGQAGLWSSGGVGRLYVVLQRLRLVPLRGQRGRAELAEACAAGCGLAPQVGVGRGHAA